MLRVPQSEFCFSLDYQRMRDFLALLTKLHELCAMRERGGVEGHKQAYARCVCMSGL